MPTRFGKGMAIAGLAMGMMAAPAFAADTIRIAYIDPLSGMMAPIGEQGLADFRFMADRINAAGGVAGKKLEIVPMDNKLSAQEAVVQAQKAVDQGIHIIAQGNSSGIAAALIDFANKNNERNPGKEVLYINYAAVDPPLTNEKCSYWHFRWDANSDIKMQALTSYMKTNKNIKKVYLINQDYSFGHSVRKAAIEMLKAKRPDVQIVGDELHPIAKITDFSPYVAKIKASGADSVITGNWGSDIALLLKAAGDAGLEANFYTYYAGGAGGPTAVKQSGLNGKVFGIVEGLANAGGGDAAAFEEAFRKTHDYGWTYPRVRNAVEMVAEAINKVGSDDPKKLVPVLAGMKHKTMYGGEAFMRETDHQFFQDMYIANLVPVGGDVKFDEEKTGWGWHVVAKVPAQATIVNTTCKMQKPS
ncbi:MAG TPA: branched-chain amino acid ABC transporter substrate-binding protein [Ferrovibrio sp.]|uniref:branched-chain amino acid ABC transporter substrate-binding protein n=1 Tax=Ferrovibrio sp. TaxID=1917215 RepID=UPI002ED1A295